MSDKCATPTPWKLDGSYVIGENGDSVADMLQWSHAGPANARLIVTALTTRTELIAALDAAYRALTIGITEEELRETIERIRTVLVNVK